MNLLKFIPIKMTILLVLGIMIGNMFNFSIWPVFILTLISFLVLSLIFWKQKDGTNTFFGGLAALTIICVGILIAAMAKPENAPDHYANENLNEQGSYLLKIKEQLKPTDYSLRYIAEVKRYNKHKVSGNVILSCPVDSTVSIFGVDDELMVLSTAIEIKAPLNPHQFNYKKYLDHKGVTHQIALTKQNHFPIENAPRTFLGYAASTRNKIIAKLKTAGFEKDELSIIQALFLGQRDAISQTTYANYKDAGAVHILAVSGLHIGILLLFLQFLLQPLEKLPKGQTLKLVVIVILLWGFAFLAGLSASIVRAVTMFTFVAYAMYLNRPQNTFNILALSMFFILLLFNPLLLFDVGFQMSYAAVFAIVWIYPILQKLWYPKNWFLKKVWQLLSVSIAAQIGVLPISLYYFHQFPGLFFVSNLLIIPFLGLILGIGILVIALILFDLAPNSVVEIYNSIIGLMNLIIEWVAKQEAFVFRNVSFDIVQLIMSYILIICFVWALTKTTFKRVVAVLSCVLILQGWWLYTQQIAQQKDILLVNHQTKNSIITNHKGAELNIFSLDSISSKRVLENYQIAERIDQTKYQSIQNSYTYKDKNIMIIDSSGTFSIAQKPIDYVLLTQSPKVNLDRLIAELNPKVIIADGSNYHSYVNRWQKTCDTKKLPFHYTGEKGAYIFK